MRKDDEKKIYDALRDFHKRIKQLKAKISTENLSSIHELQFEYISYCSWQDKIKLINEAKTSDNSGFLLRALEVAVEHLQQKQDIPLFNGAGAHSDRAAALSAFSRTSSLGAGLFRAGAEYFQNRGIRKQLQRIELIDNMLQEIERTCVLWFRV
jgi:hypothetical protein